jgi:hypothetical protein
MKLARTVKPVLRFCTSLVVERQLKDGVDLRYRDKDGASWASDTGHSYPIEEQ